MHRPSLPMWPLAVGLAVVLGAPFSASASSVVGARESKPMLSLDPVVIVRNATPEQEHRLDEAVARFGGLGLALPDLEVSFSSDPEDCGGHPGRFEDSSRPWRISICSDLGFVYEHELAHAWEHANLSDEQRREFMSLRDVSVWNDSGVEWSERGVEQVAFVVQQNLLGGRLRDVSPEWQNRLDAFELLTGSPSPRAPEEGGP